MIELSGEDARRAAVGAQLLDGRAPTTVTEVVQALGAVQVDPVASVARAEQMVLFSRLGPYDVAEARGRARPRRAVRVLGAHRRDVRLRHPSRGDAALSPRRPHACAVHQGMGRGECRVPPLRAPGAPAARAVAVARPGGPLDGAVAHRRVERREGRRPHARHPLVRGSRSRSSGGRATSAFGTLPRGGSRRTSRAGVHARSPVR